MSYMGITFDSVKMKGYTEGGDEAVPEGGGNEIQKTFSRRKRNNQE
jgi:hypothetical protein